MNPIRILLIDTGKEWGGGTNSMIELLKRIDRKRFQVTTLFYENYAKGQDWDLRRELESIGVSLTLLPQIRRPVWAKIVKEIFRTFLFWSDRIRSKAIFKVDYVWRIKPNAARIKTEVIKGKYDLLYMNNQPSSNLEGYLAGKDTGLPVVQHARIVAQLNQMEIQIASAYATRIICVSQGVQDDLVRQGIDPAKCAVVYNGIDTNQTLPIALSATELRDANPNQNIRIGVVGQLVARKAVGHVLEAAVLILAQSTTRFTITIIGTGPEREHLEEKTRQLGLSEIVTFRGFLANPIDAMMELDVVVLSSAAEGFPRVVLEAMLLAKPVVATRIAGTQELVRDGVTGLLYEFGDIDALAGHLKRLMSDDSLRRAMGRAGRSVVENDYSIEKYVTGVERILSEAQEEGRCSIS